MAAEMTSRERLLAVFEHRTPDRVPVRESPWGATVARWRREGLPADVAPADYFGWDRIFGIGVDNSPRYPARVIEETEEYKIVTTSWGTKRKDWKTHGGVPEFLDFTIVDRDTWAAAKERMTPSPDRVNWDKLATDYAAAQKAGSLLMGHGWFGYDAMINFVVGTERGLMAMVTDPDWCREMFSHQLEVNLALLEMAWDRGYKFDVFHFCDDLGYRNGLLFSPATYRRVSKPVHTRAAQWCHDRGVKVFMHSCGNVTDLVGEFVDYGADALEPLEQKAGMDALALKKKFGDKLAFMGGVDVRKWVDAADIEAEVVTKLEALKQGSGYIFHSDHSVPEDVSFANYCRVMELVRQHGRYD
ncbi:MAG: uroporphyrinogen decarboxylase family protein [Phycisphaerae bacterium]|nr:uroporphyrinogen decarboxylase family protein [Phycisphaerae bacterium]